MDKAEFSRQVSSYIDFNTIKRTLMSYTENKEKVMGESAYFLGSQNLSSNEDWGLYNLVCDYLSEFRIPEESISLVEKLEKEGLIDQEAIHWLKNYRFTGKLIKNPEISNDFNRLPVQPIILLIAEQCIIDILSIPINFLIGAVEDFSLTWRKVESQMSVFFEPSSPSELLVYLEKQVALSSKNLKIVSPGSKFGDNIYVGHRYVCATSDLPMEPKTFNLARIYSHQQAISTYR